MSSSKRLNRQQRLVASRAQNDAARMSQQAECRRRALHLDVCKLFGLLVHGYNICSILLGHEIYASFVLKATVGADTFAQ